MGSFSSPPFRFRGGVGGQFSRNVKCSSFLPPRSLPSLVGFANLPGAKKPAF